MIFLTISSKYERVLSSSFCFYVTSRPCFVYEAWAYLSQAFVYGLFSNPSSHPPAASIAVHYVHPRHFEDRIVLNCRFYISNAPYKSWTSQLMVPTKLKCLQEVRSLVPALYKRHHYSGLCPDTPSKSSSHPDYLPSQGASFYISILPPHSSSQI